ncbi:energy transducer TonB [Pedobacter sp. AW31-3R]|uniref:energy transducer TonB n=1 Tax=Pedobacter sp. AW31-3R TaxID=3445781 RepID=UPI003F9FA336
MGRLFALIFLLFGCSVQAQPALKGGLEAFIKTNIIYPAYSWQNCVQATINVSFKLNRAGEVYFSAVSKGPGIDLDKEALRLVRLSSGKWNMPAGYDTTYVLIVPVNFRITGGNCTGIREGEMQKAIAAYKANEGLTDAIINFYRNKSAGKYNEADETRIIALKKELGYDEEWMEAKIQEGQKKLRQKDYQGACEDFLMVKYMGSSLADQLLERYCK